MTFTHESPEQSEKITPSLTVVPDKVSSDAVNESEFIHTALSIANDNGFKKAQVKYAIKKLGALMGREINRTRYYTDAERLAIESELGIEPATKRVENALAVVVEPVANVLDAYDPVQFLATTQRYKAADDSVQIDQGNQALALLMQQVQADDNAATAALVQQAQNRGRKLGAMLAQVEIGTAMQEKQTVKNAFFEANGVVEGSEN